MNEEQIKMRYTIKMEATLYGTQRPQESREDFIDRLADNIFYGRVDALDGQVRDITDFEER